MKIHIYYLVNVSNGIPFYAGATMNINKRRIQHKSTFKKSVGALTFNVHKTVNSWQKATKEESNLIIKLKKIYGDNIINKNKPMPHRAWGKERTSRPFEKLQWVDVSNENKDVFFKFPPKGGCAKISAICGFSVDYIFRVLLVKPDKVKLRLYRAILEYRSSI